MAEQLSDDLPPFPLTPHQSLEKPHLEAAVKAIWGWLWGPLFKEAGRCSLIQVSAAPKKEERALVCVWLLLSTQNEHSTSLWAWQAVKQAETPSGKENVGDNGCLYPASVSLDAAHFRGHVKHAQYFVVVLFPEIAPATWRPQSSPLVKGSVGSLADCWLNGSMPRTHELKTFNKPISKQVRERR